MRQETLNIYEFKELSEEAQRTAIDKVRDLKNQDGDLLWMFSEDTKGQLSEKGFSDIELQYSLNCCQGDGLSFSAQIDLEYFLNNVYSVKLPKWKKNALQEYIYNVCSQGNKGHYCYASFGDIEFTENYQTGKEYKHVDTLWQKVLKEIREYYVNLCADLEKQGYDEIDYQLSDECIKEDINANEYEFLENGELH